MADNVTANPGVGGAVFATDEIAGVHYTISKLAHGALDSVTLVSSASGLPVQQQGTWNVTIDTALPAGTNAIGKLAANDGVDIGNVDVTSVPAPLNVIGGGAEASALRVTIANNSTGVLSVDDNGASLTVDNAGTFAVQAAQSGTWNITNVSGTISLPTGAATETTLATIAADTTSINGKITACNTGAVVVSSGSIALSGSLPDTAAGDFAAMVVDLAAIEVLLGTIDADTGAIATSVASVDGKITACNTGAVTVSSQPARSRTTDTVSAATATDALMSGTTQLTPKFARLSTASSGDQALISAVVDKKLRVIAMQIVCTASTNAIYINDGTDNLYADGTNKLQLDDTGATGPGGYTLPYNPLGWFETGAINRPININLGSTNGVVAIATYVEV